MRPRCCSKIIELRLGSTSSGADPVDVWAEVGEVADQAPLGRERKLDICGWALRRLACTFPEAVAPWLERLALHTENDPARHAAILTSVLESTIEDRASAEELALAAATALESAGRLDDALNIYERVLNVDDPGPDLVAKIDALARRAGETLDSRVGRYLAAVKRTTDLTARAQLLFTLGAIQRAELPDISIAITTWQMAIDTLPTQWQAHEALLLAYADQSDTEAILRELVRAIGCFQGEQRVTTLLRLADAGPDRGRCADALAMCQPVLDELLLKDGTLDALEHLAEKAENANCLYRVLDRRVSIATGPSERARALEQLGDFLDGWPHDTDGAVSCWKEAAEQHLRSGEASPKPQYLYERVLGAAPNDVGAARRLVELYSEAGEWTRVAEAFGVLQRCLVDDAHARSQLLLDIEAHAVRGGAASEFTALVDAEARQLDQSASPSTRPLLAAKARVFAALGRLDEAAQGYQALVEAFGHPHDIRELEALIAADPSGSFRCERLRWLYRWRSEHAPEPVPVLLQWATVEDEELGDRSAAIAVLERAMLQAPSNTDVLARVTRLKLESGDVTGGLAALGRLRELTDDVRRRDLELSVAEALVGRLGAFEHALPLLRSVLEVTPKNALARQLAFQVVAKPSPVRDMAAALLETSANADEDAAVRRTMLSRLLDATEDDVAQTGGASVEVRSLRQRWFAALLDLEVGPSAISVATRAAAETPSDESTWEKLEAIACRHGQPQAATQAYQVALQRDLSPDAAEMLGRRLTAFADQRTVDRELLTAALKRVLELSPGARWALDRVKVGLTIDRRWPELFALYDRAIAAARDPSECVSLLDEAVIVAKDVAGDTERAIGYVEHLFRLSSNDARLDVLLERMYERQGQTGKLVAHLSHRAESLDGPKLQQMRTRIGGLWIELNDGRRALEVADALLADNPEDESAVNLLEQILALPEPPSAVPEMADSWRYAASLAAQRLKHHYARLGHNVDVARVVEADLRHVHDQAGKAERLRELFDLRWTELSDREGALACLCELVVLQPDIADNRVRLSQLAADLGAHRRLADTLVAASERTTDANIAVELLWEAAGLYLGPVEDPTRGAEVCARVLTESVDPAVRLRAARTLDGILNWLDRPSERCDLLEESRETRGRSRGGACCPSRRGAGRVGRACGPGARRQVLPRTSKGDAR